MSAWRGWAAALALFGLAAGCAPRERVVLDVGRHRVSIEMPSGWRRIDLGSREELQHGENVIAFEDLGPMGREGIRAEVARARVLARDGHLQNAQAALQRIRVPDDLFHTPDHRRAFWDDWSRIAHAPPGVSTAAADAAFERLLDAVETLAERDPQVIEREILQAMGTDSRREVASRETIRIGDRSARQLDTWHRMTHERRGRHLIVLANDAVLVAWTLRGDFERTAPVFDRVVASLQFEPEVRGDPAEPAAVTGR